jgi:hypothetical protein
VDRPGPLTSALVLAEADLAGWDKSSKARVDDRSDFYLKLESRRQPVWLVKNLLVPSEKVSAEEFSKSIRETLVTLRNMQINTSENMIGDAAMSPNPAQEAQRLRERHSNDLLVAGQLNDTFGFPRSSEPGESGGWEWFLILACVILLLLLLIWFLWRHRQRTLRRTA